MECALCKNPVLADVHGFAQLPCKHNFHLRCMVPSCNGFWGQGEIGCKICLAAGNETFVEVANNDDVVQLPNNEQANRLVNQLTVDEAYRIMTDIEDRDYEERVADHVKTLTDQQKADFKMYVATCRQGRKLRSTVQGILIRRRREFIQSNNHLICAFNKVYRKFVNDFIGMDIFKIYKKTYKKNRRLYRNLLENATDGHKYTMDDICFALKYSRIPAFLNYDITSARTFKYNCRTISDMLFDVKKSGKSLYK